MSRRRLSKKQKSLEKEGKQDFIFNLLTAGITESEFIGAGSPKTIPNQLLRNVEQRPVMAPPSTTQPRNRMLARL